MQLLQTGLLTLLFFAAISIVRTSLQTGISPMPSSGKARQAMIAAARANKGTVIDLGSGWGTLAIAFARKHPQRQVIGYEASWVPWLASLVCKHAMRLNNLTLHRRDFLHADLSGASILLCYLFPRGMQQLRDKLETQKGQPGLIISNTFALPGATPFRIIQLDDFFRSPIYVYQRQNAGAATIAD